MSSRAVLCSVLALLAACPDDDPVTSIDAAPVDVAPMIDVVSIDVAPSIDAGPLTPSTKLDVLLLVDDSASMGDKQALLAASVPSLHAALMVLAPDVSLRAAVVTSTVGIALTIPGAPQCGGGKAVFRPGNGCLTEGSFLTDEPGDKGRVTNGVDGAENALACLVKVGVAGCGFEQQFKAIRQSLDGTAGNPDFLREDAALLVLVLSDEDDCSGKPGDALFDPAGAGIESLLGPLESFRCTEFGLKCNPDIDRTAASYDSCEPDLDSAYLESPAVLRDFLVEKKGDARRVAVATIVGPTDPVTTALATNSEGQPVVRLNPSCVVDPSPTGIAAPAVRLSWLGQQFPHHAQISICSEFGDDMGDIALQALAAMGRNPP